MIDRSVRVCWKGLVLKQEGAYKNSFCLEVSCSRFFIGFFFFQSQAASAMMSPFQERRAHGFTFLEFEQVGTWSLSMGVRGALQAGQECLRGASKRSQPGCISAAQRNEQLPKGGRSNS